MTGHRWNPKGSSLQNDWFSSQRESQTSCFLFATNGVDHDKQRGLQYSSTGMKVVNHNEMGSLIPLLDSSSWNYGYGHNPLDLNVFQKCDQRWGASTKTNIENCIIKKIDNRNNIDGLKMERGHSSNFFSRSRTDQEERTSLIILNGDGNLNIAPGPKEENASFVHDWPFEDKMAHFLNQNSFLCQVPHTSHDHDSKENGCASQIIANERSPQFNDPQQRNVNVWL